VPPDLRRNKGWIGQLFEAVLGATASSRAQPDFPHLHVEMKTLPVSPSGRPRESTYVCTAPMGGQLARSWDESWVRRKLSRVLWVPIVSDKGIPPGDRVVGMPFLWGPDAQDEQDLRSDWETLTELIALGELWQLNARHGKVLQLRPKAARASERAWVLGSEGDWVQDTKRGFYLRPSFTLSILSRALKLPRSS
jgi:DNA mismatch repair protein MutH